MNKTFDFGPFQLVINGSTGHSLEFYGSRLPRRLRHKLYFVGASLGRSYEGRIWFFICSLKGIKYILGGRS